MNTPNTLLEDTQRLLKSAKTPRREIARGAAVGNEWLAKFSQGRINDPGVRKVQRLHDFLLYLKSGGQASTQQAA